MTENNTVKTEDLLTVSIESEMKKSYLDYAMSVIVSRAIPDVRDGLKPVHRRILFGMLELGCEYNKPYKKSARIVGDVMGKFHPHGDSAIYDALVRMAQPFSMRLELVDGQGNFGSMDGDAPAAMRYTESRLSKAAHALLSDIDKQTVDFQDNYDGSEKEPVVLPAAYPNILVNGAGGIAVGMATNIPPHNLGEVVDACMLYLDNQDVSMDELLAVCPAPDFPTGGIILGQTGARSGLSTGRGSVVLRAKTEFEEIRAGRQAIIVTEIPYQVNKVKLQERIAELVNEKKLEGISDMRDESNKLGVRLVIELKKDAVPDVVLSQLFAYTQLQTSFGVNMLALDNGRPAVMNLKQIITSFINFREEVITRRTNYLLNKARDRAHILIGLAIAVANIDEVIAVIKASADPNIAREELMRRDWESGDILSLLQLVDDSGNKIIGGRIKFTETQARAILELRLARLTGMEREKIDAEMAELAAEIAEYLSILGDKVKLYGILRAEMLLAKEQFATPRRTAIEFSEFEADIEDLIQKEDMVVTITTAGYIKRTALSAYRAQRRGGKGKSGMSVRDEDITSEILVVNTHTPVLFFSSLGKVYKLKVYRLPVGAANTRGKALVNIFPLANDEKITTFMPLPEDESKWDDMNIMFATAKGNARRNDLSDFHDIRSNGKIAIRMDEDDKLIGVKVCNEEDNVLLASKAGKCVRFPVSAVRVFKSRTSDGVRGMKLASGDEVVSMSILGGITTTSEERAAYLKMKRASHPEGANATEGSQAIEQDPSATPQDDEIVAEVTLSEERFAEMAEAEEYILTITENGYGKRTSAYEYRTIGRGGSGMVNIVTSDRNGSVVSSQPIGKTGQIMLMTDRATVIRCPIDDVRVAGRNTQGVTILRTGEGEKVVSVVTVPEGEAVDDGVEGGEEV